MVDDRIPDPASDGLPPAPADPRYWALDVWRGVACLMIVLLHAAFHVRYDPEPAGGVEQAVLRVISRMSVGVPIFFVISGYCIAATADSSRRRWGGRSWAEQSAHYFRRRFRRIFPPYWAALALTALLAIGASAAGWQWLLEDTNEAGTGSVPAAASLTPAQWFGNVTLTETWRPHLFGGPENKLLGPAWTLCYEEQFYLVCGVLLLVAPRRFFAGAAVVTLATLAVAAVGFVRPSVAARVQGFFIDGRWLMFALGVAVFYHLNYARARGGWGTPALLIAAFVSVAVLRYGLLAGVATQEQKERLFELVVSVAFALLILFARPADGWLKDQPLLRPLVLCGQMCYSLYLVHWPITKVISQLLYSAGVTGPRATLLVVIPVTTLASIAVAWVFHLVIERRFLNPPQRVPPRLPAGGAAGVRDGGPRDVPAGHPGGIVEPVT